jgi:hypothetical protein
MSAAPKYSDEGVRAELADAIACKSIWMEVRREAHESLAQEVLDRRTADGINQHTINEQRKEMGVMRDQLRRMAARLDDAEQLQKDMTNTFRMQADDISELRTALVVSRVR